MLETKFRRKVLAFRIENNVCKPLKTNYVPRSPLDFPFRRLLKHVFDFTFSVAVLILLAPVFCFIAVLIKLDSTGPVFYCPLRVGRHGHLFKMYKFRSMRECDTTFGGTQSTQENDSRISAVGKILRRYSLDELPQFINVLRGEMSVIGPRPHRKFLSDEMEKSVEKYAERQHVKPGITGWAQVNGWRGPTSTLEQKVQRTEHDLWYIENWSFVLDLKIIYLTIFGKKTHFRVF
ncbi:MAG: sugar transferase [Candidatus Paceibacterota bacterium]